MPEEQYESAAATEKSSVVRGRGRAVGDDRRTTKGTGPILEGDDGDQHDFDFLMGREWRVENRVLEEVGGNDEWDSFVGVLRDAKPILGASVRSTASRPRAEVATSHATSIRIYDPNEATWRIYWTDSFGYRVTPQVEGTFVNAVGTFLGEERFNGRMVKMRFLWSDTQEHEPLWEQAYFRERTGEWETNWTMRFVPL